MDAAVAGLIGATIGAVTALLGALISGRMQSRLEEQKAARATQSALAQELRVHISEVARKMLSAQHSMEWITWYADENPEALDRELVSAYEQEIHQTFPDLLGALAVVASLNLEIYKQLTPIADEIYRLESRVAKALALLNEASEESLKSVRELRPIVTELYRTLPLQIADILRMTENYTFKNTR